jgi:tetratricopeptide (TPR) repeat protein
LNRQLRELVRHNLVERNVSPPNFSWRLHRSLQLSLLLKLDSDRDKRQMVFSRAVSLVRHAFPKRDMAAPSVEDEPLWKLSLPHVLSLQKAFETSDPPIDGNVEFASLLTDAGSFLWEQEVPRMAYPILVLAEKVHREAVPVGQPSPILASIELYLASLNQQDSADNNDLVQARLQRAVTLTEDVLKSLPEGTATIEQRVDVSRAWNDLAFFHAKIEDFTEAERLMRKCMQLNRSIGTEDTLKYRFALQYADFAVVLHGQGRLEEALEFARRSYELCKEIYGRDHCLTARFLSRWSYVLIAVGNLQDALDKQMDVLKVRRTLLSADNKDILTSKYWIGTIYYYMGKLQEAE